MDECFDLDGIDVGEEDFTPIKITKKITPLQIKQLEEPKVIIAKVILVPTWEEMEMEDHQKSEPSDYQRFLEKFKEQKTTRRMDTVVPSKIIKHHSDQIPIVTVQTDNSYKKAIQESIETHEAWADKQQGEIKTFYDNLPKELKK